MLLTCETLSTALATPAEALETLLTVDLPKLVQMIPEDQADEASF